MQSLRFVLWTILVMVVLPCCIQAQDASNLSWEELDSLRTFYEDEGDFDAALNYAELAVKAAEQDSFQLCDALANLGLLNEYFGAYEEAERILLQAKKLTQKVYGTQSAAYALALSDLAGLNESLGQYKKAETLYQQVLKIEKKELGEDNPDYALSLSNLGGLYESMKRYEEAEILYLQAQKTMRASRGVDDPDYGLIINNLAATYKVMGRYEEAEPLYLQALKIDKAYYGENHPDYGIALNNLAVLYENMRRFSEAEPLYFQTLEIYKNAYGEEHPAYALILNNLAALYDNKKQYAKAIEILLKAIQIAQRTYPANHPKFSSLYNNISGAYHYSGDYKKAEFYVKKAIKIDKINTNVFEAGATASACNLAFLYQEQGRYQEAERIYLETIKVRSAAKSHINSNDIITFNNLADIYIVTKRYEQALKIISQSFSGNSAHAVSADRLLEELHHFTSAKSLFYTIQGINTFKQLAELKYDQYTESQEIRYLEERFLVLKTYGLYLQNLQKSFFKKKDKLRVLTHATDNAYLCIAAAHQLFELTNEQVYLDEAINFAEQNKSAILSNALHSEYALAFGDVPDSLVQQERHIKRELASIEKALIQAETKEDSSSLQQELIAINIRQDALKKVLAMHYPKYNQLQYQSNSMNAQQIQETLLDDKTALLEYFVYKDTAVFLILITKNDLKLFPIQFKKGQLNTQIKTLRKSLSNYNFILSNPKKSFQTFADQAALLYQQIIAPTATHLKEIDHLIIVPDGVLGHIPFEILIYEGIAQTEGLLNTTIPYLLQKYSISYSYSASLLLENKAQTVQNNGQLIAFGATYNPKDSLLFSTRSDVQQHLRKTLQPLDAIQMEIQGLQEQLAQSGQFLYSTAATETAFKNQAKQYSIIHLAMHGVLNPKYPLLSALAFTENGDSLNDNFLEAHEISSLKLNSNLVVLSACETGYGRFEQGEGVMSLARSFMYAGVPSLVVSLWQVNDVCTELIMKEFYHNLSLGMSKDKALQKAKLDYIKTSAGIANHPAFWSPFIQIGDSSPIHFKSKYSYLFWLGLGFVLGLIGLLYWRRRKREKF